MQEQIIALQTILTDCTVGQETPEPQQTKNTPTPPPSEAVALPDAARQLLLTLFLLTRHTTAPLPLASVGEPFRSRLQVGSDPFSALQRAGYVVSSDANTVALTEAGLQVAWQLV